MTPLALSWDDLDHATDGDGAVWTINSEQVRGEGRLYWLDQAPRWAHDVAEAHRIDTAHHDKRVVKRRAEQLRRLRGDRR